MAQLLLAGIQMFCGVPAAPVLGSLLAAAIPVSPINWIVFAAWFLGLKYSKAAWVQRFKGPTKTLLKNTLLFYALTILPLYALIITFACRAVG
ncbi:hypothetical protein WJX74_001533 [Apatococcus lobatus]|uniref:Uncharacterized protein n=1 Tax=Apatococcus lobatus TaxID=904363 RepID=A0AAW1QZJ7_9CHLO